MTTKQATKQTGNPSLAEAPSHLEAVEAHYSRTPLVKELAVIDLPRAGERREWRALVAVPDLDALRERGIANSREAIRYAFDDLGRDLDESSRIQEYAVRLTPLPRCSSGTVDRNALASEFAAGGIAAIEKTSAIKELSGPDQELLASPAGAAVTAAIHSVTGDKSAVHPEMNLELDLGLDSLGRAEMLAALEMRLGIDLSPAEAVRALSVRELIDLVSRALPMAGTNGAEPEGSPWAALFRNSDPNVPELRRIMRDRPVFMGITYAAYRAFNLFCRAFMRLEVSGLENLRSMRPPFIVCPNHQSFFDPFIVCSLYPFSFFRNSFHLGASYFFKGRIMSFVGGMLHIVPVDADMRLASAMKAAAAALKGGKILNIYPEGERAYDGRLHEFKDGASVFAVELGLPIIPVALDGLHNVWPRRTFRIRPGRAKVRFGEPFLAADVSPLSDDHRSARARYERVTEHLERTISGMIGEMRQSDR